MSHHGMDSRYFGLLYFSVSESALGLVVDVLSSDPDVASKWQDSKSGLLRHCQTLINLKLEKGTPFTVQCLETLQLWMKLREEKATWNALLELLQDNNLFVSGEKYLSRRMTWQYLRKNMFYGMVM